MTLSAHIQFIPLHHAEPMAAVDVAIGIIQSSGLAYEVGPFGTSVEGASNTVEELVRLLLHSSISEEFLLNVQFHVGDDKLSNTAKVAKFR